MLIVLSSLIAPLQKVYASTNTSDLAPGDTAKSFAYYKALRHCMDIGSYSNSHMAVPVVGPWVQYKDMNQDNAVSFEWFADRAVSAAGGFVSFDNTATVGVINDAKDNGVTNCGGSSGKTWITAAAKLWGYTSGPQLLCDLGFTREVKGSACTETPAGASNKFYAPDNATSQLDDFWKTRLASGSLDLTSITVGGEYRLYADSFQLACLPSSVSYTIQTFTSGSLSPTPTTYQASSQGNDSNTNVRLYQDRDIKCKDLAALIDKADSPAVLGYIQYLKKHNGKDDSYQQNGCIAGSTDPRCNSDTGTSTCGVVVIGWIICPAVGFLAQIADGAFGFLANNFLQTSPKIFDTGSPTFSVWSTMRNIANVAFVIAFLIIIFSQVTSVGITNYGVKKMLPRIIIAAILVNVSFFVCQIAVDISNILGYSLKSMFESVGAAAIPATANTTGAAGNWTNGGGFTGFAGSILAGVGGLALIYANLAALIPVLLAAVVALVMILFILVARQAIIIILIVISPLAFVAFLLPNTEQWYKKWQKTFVAMLMLFPIVAVVFGGSSLASKIIGSTIGAEDSSNMFAQIIAAATMVLPLFVIPGLLKKALDGVDGLGAKVNGIGAKLGGALGKKGSQGYENSRLGQFKKYRAGESNIRRAKVQSGVYSGRGGKLNPLNTMSKVNSWANSKAFTGKFGDRSAASGIALVKEAEGKETKEAALRLDNMNLTRPQIRAIMHDQKADPAMRRAAINKTAATNDINGINEMVEASNGWDESLRLSASESLGSSSSRPSYVGQGTLAMMRLGKSLKVGGKGGLVDKAIQAGAYSAAKIAQGDGDELTYVAAAATQLDDITRVSLAESADKAINDPILGKTIGKNRAAVDHLSSATEPTEDELKLMN